MNPILKEILKNITPKGENFRKKLLSFSFFLIISTFFWFLNSLAEKYNEHLLLPLEYINLPKDKQSTLDLPSQINTRVDISGYGYLEYLLNANRQSIIVDYKKALRLNYNKNHRYILSESLTDKLLKKYPDLNLFSIKPDTILFYYDKIEVKKVPIKPLAIFNITEGYVKSGEVYSKPDSVIISGPIEKIRSISFVNTGLINLKDISKTTKRNVALKEIESISFRINRTNVTVPVEQSTEKLIKIPIIVENLIDNEQIKLIPNTLKISYKVGISRYAGVSNEQFTARVVYTDSTKFNNVLKVEISKFPDNVYAIEFTPKFVEFIKATTND